MLEHRAPSVSCDCHRVLFCGGNQNPRSALLKTCVTLVVSVIVRVMLRVPGILATFSAFPIEP